MAIILDLSWDWRCYLSRTASSLTWLEEMGHGWFRHKCEILGWQSNQQLNEKIILNILYVYIPIKPWSLNKLNDQVFIVKTYKIQTKKCKINVEGLLTVELKWQGWEYLIKDIKMLILYISLNIILLRNLNSDQFQWSILQNAIRYKMKLFYHAYWHVLEYHTLGIPVHATRCCPRVVVTVHYLKLMMADASCIAVDIYSNLIICCRYHPYRWLKTFLAEERTCSSCIINFDSSDWGLKTKSNSFCRQ